MPRKRPPNLDEPSPRTRTATAEEQALWHQVMGQPLPVLLEEDPTPTTPPAFPPITAEEAPSPEIQNVSISANASSVETAENQQATRIDWKTARAIRRGTRQPEARLDLHGLYREQAHQVLKDFLESAQARHQRFVLIITGKGRGGESRGVLRESLPIWLSTPPCRARVEAFTPANAHDGGEGAWYVLLRKPPA